MTRRASMREVEAWIAGSVPPLAAETIASVDSLGRIAAVDLAAPVDIPPADRAAVDGIALRAGESVGASSYNPLSFRLVSNKEALPAGGAALVEAGDSLPAGADAVAALEQFEMAEGLCGLVEPVGPGANVEPVAAHFAAGTRLLRAGEPIDAARAAVLALAGIETLAVTRRPRIRLLRAARARSGESDADTPLISGLLARDGGLVAAAGEVARDPVAIAAALRAPGADVLLLVGGTGAGPHDFAAAGLAAAGQCVFHGVALLPGETAGLGRTASGVPVFLLPGAPAACLWAYELLAGPAIRRLGNRAAALPFPLRRARAARKIVSSIGMTEICPVTLRGEEASPIPSFAEMGLAAALAADGIVIVPESSEGYPAGSEIWVHLLRSDL